MTNKLLDSNIGSLILRLATGGLMLFHGISKLIHGHEHIKEMLVEKGFPRLLWLGVPLTEVVAPVLLIFGVFTRLSGLGIAFVMLFSIILAFGTNSLSLTAHGGLLAELNILFLFAGLSLFFLGGGKYALYKPKNEWLK